MGDAPLTPPTILIFDSGVGGLSVADELAAKRPAARLIYAADAQFLPYGLKSDAELKARVPALLTRLAERYRPDAIIIACNTASTIALAESRAVISIPIVGTVPAIKPAAARSVSRVIGFLGTPGTVEREYSDELIRQFGNGCEIVRQGSAELVGLAERKLGGEAIPPAEVAAALAPMFAKPHADRMDVAVLACTHFPLLRAEIEAASPPNLAWIDSGEAVARRALDVLGLAPGSGAPQLAAVFCTAPETLRAAAPAFVERGYPDYEAWHGPDA